jgi:exodeoxyribonuclease X
MADWTSLTHVVVDVEGNGRQPPDLGQLAAVPIVGGTIGEPVSWLVRPDQPIKHFATRIHGLTNRDVADAPVFAAIRDDVLAALDGAALVAHNAHVDIGVLSRKFGAWQRPEVFDTLKLAHRLLPDRCSCGWPRSPARTRYRWKN